MTSSAATRHVAVAAEDVAASRPATQKTGAASGAFSSADALLGLIGLLLSRSACRPHSRRMHGSEPTTIRRVDALRLAAMMLATAGERTDLDPPRERCVSRRPANRPGVYREGRGPRRHRRTPRTIPRTRPPAKTVHSGTVTCGMSNRTLTPRVFSATNTTAIAPTTTVVTRRGVSNGRSPLRCHERGARRGGGGGCGGGGPYVIAPTPSDGRCVQLASRSYPVGWWKHTAVVAPPWCAHEGRSCRCRKAADQARVITSAGRVWE
jgi:hypothetical protein